MSTKPKPVTTEEVSKAMADYAGATNQITTLDAQAKEKIKAIQVKLDTDKQKYTEQAMVAHNVLERYAKENGNLFEGKKSISLPGGTIGYRAGVPKVELLEGETEETVIKKLEKYLPNFVKVAKSIIKGGLGAQPANQLKKCGLKIEEGVDTFFVKTA
jgi:phage host-nuclease inhibitor protein Gam